LLASLIEPQQPGTGRGPGRTGGMDDDLCIHDMWIRSCHLCKAPPPGVNPSGFTTRGGRAYHNDRDCEWLRRGQRRADRAGMQLHDITRVRWADQDLSTVQPCLHCCRPAGQRGSRTG
jgi:hypothetical protein